MKVHFWGTRGSVPSCFSAQRYRDKLFKVLEQVQGQDLAGPDAIERFIEQLPFSLKGTYGTCTPCVEIEVDPQTYILCDAGSGLWSFGLKAHQNKKPVTYHVFLSHLHWDHVQGLPMFAVECKAEDTLVIHARHEETEAFLRAQMNAPGFPVTFDELPCSVIFDVRKPEEAFEAVKGFQVSTLKQRHAGDSYAYRFEKEGKAIVYATDAEHHEEELDPKDTPFVDFFKDADLLIFDTMATVCKEMSYWGHSTHCSAIMLSAWARVKKVVLFHQNPALDDEALDQLLEDARCFRKEYFEKNKSINKGECYPQSIIMAYDSLELDT
tara:strand:+ start:59694 stop:60665 length:972 start_codon:yes stop_codon:yes gene_type:complete